MKKALVVLLILAVAGGAFAQLTFSGHLRGGIGLSLNDNDNQDPALTTYMVGDGLIQRFELQGSYTNDDGTAGARFVFRGQDFHTALVTQVAEAWFKALDGMITIYGGRLDSAGPFGTGGGIDSSWDIGAGSGMFINVAPIAGLDIRASVFPNTRAAVSYSAAQLMENARYNFGFAYTAPGLVTVIAQLRQSNGAVYDMTDVLLGIKVLALQSMGLTTLNVDAAILNLQKSTEWQENMLVQIGQQIAFTSGDLTIGGRFRQQLILWEGDAPDSYTPDLAFAVWFQYVMGNIVPRLDAGFGMGRGLGTDFRGNWDGIGKSEIALASTTLANGTITGFDKDAKNLVIQPSVAFRFANANRYIKLGFAFQKDLSDPEPATTMRSTIFVDYRVNF